VDVDEPRHHELAARVEHARGLCRQRRLDRGDTAARDTDVAHAVKAQRWVDHAAAFDQQIEAPRLRERAGDGQSEGRAGGRARHEIASSQH